MSGYDRMVGRSGGHTADGLGSTKSSGADKFNAAMAGQEGDLGMTGKEMLDAMRNVVLHGPTGQSSGMQSSAESTVRLTMTHSNLVAIFPEIVCDRHTTIEGLKEKVRLHCGSSVADMQLSLKDGSGRLVAELSDDSKMIGYYSPMDGWIVHCTDTNPYSLSANGGLEDVSLVQKYEMSDADYAKRDTNYRKWKAEKLAADPEWTLEKELHKNDPDWKPPEKITDEDYMKDLVDGIVEVGMRCEVSGGRRGEVAFVGKTVVGCGYWVGVKYDEPVGKNDGSVKGERYFECEMNYGGMVRPNLVQVGDYPEKDLFDSDSEDEI